MPAPPTNAPKSGKTSAGRRRAGAKIRPGFRRFPTREELEHSALEHAARMAGEGYAAAPADITGRDLTLWRVFRPSVRGGEYLVRIAPAGKEDCPCAFFQAHPQLRNCKHLIFCRAEAEALVYSLVGPLQTSRP